MMYAISLVNYSYQEYRKASVHPSIHPSARPTNQNPKQSGEKKKRNQTGSQFCQYNDISEIQKFDTWHIEDHNNGEIKKSCSSHITTKVPSRLTEKLPAQLSHYLKHWLESSWVNGTEWGVRAYGWLLLCEIIKCHRLSSRVSIKAVSQSVSLLILRTDSL